MAQAGTVDIADVVEGQQNRGFALTLFLLCCLVMLADGFDNQVINYVAPQIIAEWKINRALMTPVFNISVLGWMTGALSFSVLADRVGRRRAILLAVLLFGVFTLAIPLARNLYELAALRFFATLGIGGAMPMSIALIADYTRAKDRALRISLIYLGYTIGSSGGGFLAPEIIPYVGWRGVFYLGGIMALAIFAVLVLALPESVRYLLISGGARARILGYVKKLQPHADYGPETEFVIREPVAKKKSLPLKHLFMDGRSAMTTFLWFALGFSFMTHFFMSQWLTTLLADHMGDDAARTQGLFQMGAAFSMVVGWLIDKRGIPVMTWIMILGALPVAAMGVLVDAGTGVMWALALISGILVLGGNIGLNAVSGMIYPTFIRSTGTGAAFMVARIGAILGPMLAGYLIYIETPIEWIFFIGAIPMIPAGIATYLLQKSMTPDAARAMAASPVMAARGQ